MVKTEPINSTKLFLLIPSIRPLERIPESTGLFLLNRSTEKTEDLLKLARSIEVSLSRVITKPKQDLQSEQTTKEEIKFHSEDIDEGDFDLNLSE